MQLRQPFPLFLLAFIAACSAGSGRDLDANGRPIGEAPDPGDLPTLANIQARVFTPVCVQCHAGANAPLGLRLDEANAFNDLVNVPSQQVNSLLRVEPFNADRSYLVQKVEGTAAVGLQMPRNLPPIPSEDMQLIRDWISDGALETSAATATAASASSVSVGSGIVSIGFSQRLDAGSVHPGTVAITRADGVPVSAYNAALSAARPNVVEIRLGFTLDGATGYVIEVNTGDALQLLDETGRPVAPYTVELR